MEKHELLRRGEDLLHRCRKTGTITHSGYLSPAEQMQLRAWAEHEADCRLLFHGGGPDCERQVAFFLPDWMEESYFDPGEELCAIHIRAFFGEPGHRDYMGALLGMGIGRDWLGDIRVTGSEAWVFCQRSVLRHLLSIEQVGRCHVEAEERPLGEAPAPELKVTERSFTVASLRLDTLVGGLFGLSRSEAARQIAAGAVSVNYELCDKCDRLLREGDWISLRGKGKGRLREIGGNTRKGRTFVRGEVLK